ncbi:MAG: histidinol-phosphate transaminase [Gemmatimonadales bacterium]
MSDPRIQSPDTQPASPSTEEVTGLAGALPPASDGLALIKVAVRAQTGYTLVSPPARRKLNQNECPFDFPDDMKREVFDQVSAEGWHRYPEFAPHDLLAAVARHYQWIADGVLVGNGSNELIQAVLSVTLGHGDVVVAPSPTFALYRLITAVLGGRYVPVPLAEGFTFDVDRLIEAAQTQQARVVVVNSPNNPTGSALPDDGVERLLAETDALVVCDEAYQDFGGPSALRLLERSSRLVVLRTFSKALGLAGLRFGVALAHPAVAREIAKGKLPYNVNLITLAAARTALRHAGVLEARTRSVIATRDCFVERLRRLSGLTVYPTAANFVLIRSLRLSAKELFRRLYEDSGILVRDVSGAAELDGCLRISIGTDEDMDAVINGLEQILESVSGKR